MTFATARRRLLAVVLAALVPDLAQAKRRRRKKGKKGKKGKKKRSNAVVPPPVTPPYCAGKTTCPFASAPFCHAPGGVECRCFTTTGGEPFCSMSTGSVADCTQCGPQETCVLSCLPGLAPVLCAVPCPNPL